MGWKLDPIFTPEEAVDALWDVGIDAMAFSETEFCRYVLSRCAKDKYPLKIFVGVALRYADEHPEVTRDYLERRSVERN